MHIRLDRYMLCLLLKIGTLKSILLLIGDYTHPEILHNIPCLALVLVVDLLAPVLVKV